MQPIKLEGYGIDNLYIDAAILGDFPKVEGKVHFQIIPRRTHIDSIDYFSIVLTYRYKDGKFIRFSPDWMIDSIQHEGYDKLTPEIIEELSQKYIAIAQEEKLNKV